MSASRDNVQVVFLDKMSISPDVKAVNLSLALNGQNVTLFASHSRFNVDENMEKFREQKLKEQINKSIAVCELIKLHKMESPNL